jgi:cyclopropane-fatty-acyl-phospholipid synthase
VSQLSIQGRMFLQILKKAKHGTVQIHFPDGKNESYGEGLPVMQVEIKAWEAFDRLVKHGDLGLAESIIEGELVVDDEAALIEWACKNDQDLGQTVYGKWYGNILARLKHFLNDNTRKQARKNIMAHYDLGNDFYRLWLDETLTYSSAIFQSPDQNLHSAQIAKYDRIIDTLEIKPGDHILEIGCGWGGFFSHAVEKVGCKVTAVMNSPQQAKHNQEKIKTLGMSREVTLLQQDYRDISGSFDKVVSIEMIEAVGEKYWSDYFGKVSASLKTKGSAMIQGITIQEDLFYSYRKGTDFIQQYVFPGGMLLTNQVLHEKGKQNGIQLADSFEFGLSYAETLKRWRENFNSSLPAVYEMGFDDKFVRLWNLYLSYCEGAFRAGRINVGQFQFKK